jgi:hypothetical protein
LDLYYTDYQHIVFLTSPFKLCLWLLVHKRHIIFDEVLFLEYQQIVPVIIRPDFGDKAYPKKSHFHTNWASAA